MCGRYALGIRAAFVRYQLQEQGLPVDNAPDDDVARETYNFPPGSFGLVYRAEVPDGGLRDYSETTQEQRENPSSEALEENNGTTTMSDAGSQVTKQAFNYELRAMKWGLIPFWTKRSPDYSSMLRTINCRDDSLSQPSGLWTTMKARKRCLVIAQGFYEWLKKGPPGTKQDKIPHFVKRKDGKLMLMAGLWDCVHYEDTPNDQKLYTYTIITTDSNKQLSFLHDRMPVILDPNTDAMKQWLDPTLNKWTNDLQGILQPFSGELECYPVNTDVGKVGNNDPSFIIPIDSKENKKNIANFFNNARKNESPKKPSTQPKSEVTSWKHSHDQAKPETKDARETKDSETTETHAPMPVPSPSSGGMKRKATTQDEGQDHDHEHGHDNDNNPPQSPINNRATKQPKLDLSPDIKSPTKPTTANNSSEKTKSTNASPASKTSTTPSKPAASTRKTRSAVSNEGISKKPSPVKGDGSQRITSFFGSKDAG